MGIVHHLEEFKLYPTALFEPDRFQKSDLSLEVIPSFKVS